MTVIACGNEEFEHAIQMSTPSTHYGQMASEPKNLIHAKSEKDTAQYNTPLHTLDMQIDLPITIPSPNTPTENQKTTPKNTSIRNLDPSLENATNTIYLEKKAQPNPNLEASQSPEYGKSTICPTPSSRPTNNPNSTTSKPGLPTTLVDEIGSVGPCSVIQCPNKWTGSHCHSPQHSLSCSNDIRRNETRDEQLLEPGMVKQHTKPIVTNNEPSPVACNDASMEYAPTFQPHATTEPSPRHAFLPPETPTHLNPIFMPWENPPQPQIHQEPPVEQQPPVLQPENVQEAEGDRIQRRKWETLSSQ
ncbi:uncharacterized protein [Nicotiana sylvestris]|uniref:uncharacterized protein n=1 Tax=Nicotiana sylvestris TaxID=4096 RepID=UPI00388C7363